MLELLIVILVIMLIFGGWRYHATGAFVGDAVGIILLVLIVLIIISFLTPFPYHHTWYHY